MFKLAQIIESDVDELINDLLGKVSLPSDDNINVSSDNYEIYQLPVKHTKGGADIDQDNKPWIVGTFLPNQYVNETHKSGHMGIDWKSNPGAPIFPVASGKVISTGNSHKSGFFVKIEHEDGAVTSFYAHLDSVNVSNNQMVDQKTVIGQMGDSGNAKGRGAHLHFEFKVNNSNIDPLSIIGKRVGSLSKKAEFINNINDTLDEKNERLNKISHILKINNLLK